MKKFAFLLALVLLLYPIQPVNASSYITLIQDTQARVLQVLDGDALRVQVIGTNQIALVRLAGIDAAGIREAQDFMTGALLGRNVELILSAADPSHPRFSSRWTPVYLIHNDVVYNRALVQRGLATVDPNYAGQWLFGDLESDANRAQAATRGIWENTGFNTVVVHQRWRRPNDRFWSVRVNINTASASQINEVLEDVVSGAGSTIVRYRPYRNIDEVMFSEAFSRSQFNEVWGGLKVSTNINTASETELLQLIDVNLSDARSIIRFRNLQRFTSIYQLRDENLISARAFDLNRDFINIDYQDEVLIETRGEIVDVNTATVQQLQSTGLTYAQANLVVNARVNGFTLKSVEEIQFIPQMRITESRMRDVARFLRVDASESWHGHHVHRPALININTATRDELWRAGFNEPQIYELLRLRDRHRGRRAMDYAGDLPFNVAEFDHAISLFTNVNRATVAEWRSLDSAMPEVFAELLARETLLQPFSTMSELRGFFVENNHEELFIRIRQFIVIR